MPESPPVNTLHTTQPMLHFPGHEHPDLPLRTGMNGLCRDPDLDRALMLTPGGGSSLIEFCNDARGLWLHVSEDVRGVHVNGRPVQRLSQLHIGDCIHCEGIEMQLSDARPRQPQQMESGTPAPSRLLLRGHGGAMHGVSVVIKDILHVSAAGNLHTSNVPQAIAQLQPISDSRAYMRVTGACEALRLNGWPVVDTWLQPGDQLLFAPDCRFLVESPGEKPAAEIFEHQSGPLSDGRLNPARQGLRVPWMLVAAIGSALALAALLWFGVR